MMFQSVSFVMAVRMNEKMDAVNVTVNVAAADVDDTVIANTLAGGNSPRVNLQGWIRRNGYPTGNVLDITWAEFVNGLGGGRRGGLQKPETAEQAAARAKRDPDYRANLLRALASLDIASGPSHDPADER